jgi:hypothetical protein
MQQQEALRHLNSLEFHMAGPSEDPVIKRFQRVQVNEMSISETTYLFLQVLAHSMELLKRKFRSVSGPEAAQIRDMAGDFVTMFKDGTIKPLVTKEAFKALLSLVLSIAGGAMDAHSIREVMTVFHSKVHMVGPEFAEQLREAISKVTDIVDLARTATESAGAEGQVKDELHHHDGAQASVEKEKPLSEEVFYSILMMLISAPAARVASARGTSADASTPVASASAHATATVFHRADDDTPSADSDPSSSR